jgi:hypothetical protein
MSDKSNRTKTRDEKFFAALALGVGVVEAAKRACYSRSAAYKYREDDKDFATRWDDAIAEYVEKLEAEADRRAVEGTAKPVYYKGERCGKIQEYSDALLMFRLKRLDPAYRERHDVNVKGSLNHNVMLVPSCTSVEDWEQEAQQQQSGLK